MSNLSISFIKSALGAGDTTVYLVDGGVSAFPIPPFYATIAPVNELPTPKNSEIVLVSEQTGVNSYKIYRKQKDTTAKSFTAGAVVFMGQYYEQSAHIGDIFMTLNRRPGTGRLFMDGGTYNREEYPLLYEYITVNPEYGTINNASGFTLRDMRGRAPFGNDSILGNLGGYGGSRTMALVPNNYRQNAWQSERLGGGLQQGFSNLGAGKGSGMNTFAGGAINAVGNNQPFEILPPYIVVNFEVVAG